MENMQQTYVSLTSTHVVRRVFDELEHLNSYHRERIFCPLGKHSLDQRHTLVVQELMLGHSSSIQRTWSTWSSLSLRAEGCSSHLGRKMYPLHSSNSRTFDRSVGSGLAERSSNTLGKQARRVLT